jgi:hypothetical protein
MEGTHMSGAKVKGQRLAFWGSQPGLELSTETPATGKGLAAMAHNARIMASSASGALPLALFRAQHQFPFYKRLVEAAGEAVPQL